MWSVVDSWLSFLTSELWKQIKSIVRLQEKQEFISELLSANTDFTYCILMLFKQQQLVFSGRRPGDKRGSKVAGRCWTPTAVLWGLPNEDEVYLLGASPSTQTRCLLLWVHSREAESDGETFCGGKRERKVFPLRASCYYSASGAEQREMSVLCLWDLTQNIMYTHLCRHTHTHTRSERLAAAYQWDEEGKRRK